MKALHNLKKRTHQQTTQAHRSQLVLFLIPHFPGVSAFRTLSFIQGPRLETALGGQCYHFNKWVTQCQMFSFHMKIKENAIKKTSN